jgi:hypothetical protein
MNSRKTGPSRAEAAGKSEQDALALKPGIKLVISGLIVFHLTAVFWAPFAFACNSGGSSSPLADPVGRSLQPYMAAMYLDHGYFFFAPNPGPSHLVRYKVEFEDGRPPVEGMFPDRQEQQPRLMYHRHFMLAEALYNRYVPPQPPPEPTPPPLTATSTEKARIQAERAEYVRTLAVWQHQRRQYESLRLAFEQRLLAMHGGSKVTITRIEHQIPAPQEVLTGGRRLTESDSYLELPEVITLEASR